MSGDDRQNSPSISRQNRPSATVIVIFKYHDDEACGVDGVLRADAKAAAAAEKKG